MSNYSVTDVACGENHTLFLTNKYEVFSMGNGFEGQLGQGTNIKFAGNPKFISKFFKERITQIATGYNHSIAVSLDGKLFVWGEGRCGQLGLGRKLTCTFEPLAVDFPENQIDSVKAGYGHTVVLSKHKVYTVGLNNFGQLGVDDRKSRNDFSQLV